MSNASVQPRSSWSGLNIFGVVVLFLAFVSASKLSYDQGYFWGNQECQENCKSDALPDGAMLIEAYQAAVKPTITPAKQPSKRKPVVKAEARAEPHVCVNDNIQLYRCKESREAELLQRITALEESMKLCGCPKDLDQPVMLRAEPKGVRWIDLPPSDNQMQPYEVEINPLRRLYEDSGYITPTAAPVLPVDNPGAFIQPGYGWYGPVGRFAQPEAQVNAVVATPEPGTFLVAGVVLMGIGWRLAA